MPTESLLLDIYPDICTNDYCSICFRTCKERRLLDGINLTKFKFLRQSRDLEVNENTIKRFCNEKICYVCDAQAMAANRFCLAVNLSDQLQTLFKKMKRQPPIFTQVKDYLSNADKPSELVHNRRNIGHLQKMLEQLRRNTTLLQTETLLLNNPGDACPEEPPSVPTATITARESLRDLITFESQPGIDDDTLFGLDASEMSNNQIIIEDDDAIREEPQDRNMFIIPDKLPTVQTNAETNNSTGYLSHPIVLLNGTLTIPSLDNNISINHSKDIVTGLANNSNNNSQIAASLNHFVVLPQTTPITHIVGTNSKHNSPHISFMQNTNILAKDIVSLVKNPTLRQKNVNFLPNNSDLGQSTATIKTLQNTSNFKQNTITSTQRANIIQNMSSTIENSLNNLHNLGPSQAVKKKAMPVKVTAAPVKRPDSDSSTDCQNIQPLRKPEGKIDWEDKIPMDVISFVSPSDSTTMTAKRQKTTSSGPDLDPMEKCVITDVKSVPEMAFIDLC